MTSSVEKEELEKLISEASALKSDIYNTRERVRDIQLPNLAKSLRSLKPIQIPKPRILWHLLNLHAMQWANNSRHLVSATKGDMVIVWDSVTRHKLHAAISSGVMTCAYGPSGNTIASGGLDRMCSVYNLNTELEDALYLAASNRLSGHTGYVSCCRFLDEHLILTSSGDRTCALWDLETSQKITTFNGHLNEVMNLAAHPKEQIFISCGCDNVAKLWDIRENICRQTFSGHEDAINSVTFFPSNDIFATASDDGTTRLYDLRADQEVSQYPHVTGVTDVAFSKSGRLIFTGCEYAYGGSNCLIWDTLKTECLGGLPNHDDRIACVGVSEDGKVLATGSWNIMRLWQ